MTHKFTKGGDTQNGECPHELPVKQLLRRAINTAGNCQKSSILWSSLENRFSDSYTRRFDAYLRLNLAICCNFQQDRQSFSAHLKLAMNASILTLGEDMRQKTEEQRILIKLNQWRFTCQKWRIHGNSTRILASRSF